MLQTSEKFSHEYAVIKIIPEFDSKTSKLTSSPYEGV